MLPAYRPAVLVSSPSMRCVQTLEPYAERLGLDIRPERLLSESRYDPRAARAWSRRRGLEPAAAVCSHGKVLPDADLRDRLTGRADAQLRKGAFAVLHPRAAGSSAWTATPPDPASCTGTSGAGDHRPGPPPAPDARRSQKLRDRGRGLRPDLGELLVGALRPSARSRPVSTP